MANLDLIEAVKAGDHVKAAMLIENGADVHQQGEQEWTPLNFAAGRGDLAIVKLLIEKGADIFKVGRDLRTPYMIALAAGRVSVVKYLREMEDQYTGEKPVRPEREYCKAYHLGDLRRYPNWTESRINWKEKKADGNGDGDSGPFNDEKIVFIHQDFTVTESMWRNANVIFNLVEPSWKDFCADSLKFKVPDDLDLIVPNEAHA
ncbi:MAG TPA: ankyrin repeat domain-containing protein [Blastocatellia bacterium]|nr:ankyrin repeat domain-containing protein [Blastocatellia bacterium]